jgi:hypothetical protein
MPSDPSLPISDALSIVRDHISDPDLLKAVTADFLKVQRELAAEKEAAKEGATNRNKNRFVVLLRGDAALKAAVAGGAFIMAVPDDETLVETYSGVGLLQRFCKAIAHQNDAPKGRRGKARTKIRTYVEAFRWLKPKAVKETESAFKIKTAEAVEVIVLEKEEVEVVQAGGAE